MDKRPIQNLPESADPISSDEDRIIVLKKDPLQLVQVAPQHLQFTTGSGGGGGGTQTTINPQDLNVANSEGQTANLNLPATASITAGATTGRMTLTTSDAPVSYDIPAFAGDGITNVITNSVVSGKGRITFEEKGSFTLNILQTIDVSSVAFGSGQKEGYLTLFFTLFASDGTKKVDFEAIRQQWNDPNTDSISVKLGGSIALNPVARGDYLEARFEWDATSTNDYISFTLPAPSATKPSDLDFTYYPNVAPVATLGNLNFTRLGYVDVESRPNETDINTAPIAAYIQKSSDNTWEVGEHSHASTLDGNTWIRDLFGRQSNPGVNKITGTGKNASVDSSFAQVSIQNSSLLFIEKPYGVAISGTRIVMAGRDNATRVKVAFGTLTNSPTSTTADWNTTAINLTFATTGANTLDVALTGDTLILLVEQSGTKKIFFSTLSGTGKDTTISSTSAGQDVSTWIDNIDANDNQLVYFGADTDTATAGDFKVGISGINGSGSSATLLTGTETNVGVLTTTGWTEAPVAQGVAFNGDTALLSVSLRKPGYLAHQRLSQEYNRIYTWAGVVSGQEGSTRDLNTLTQVSTPTSTQLDAVRNRRPRWGAGNPVPGNTRTTNDRLNIWNYTGTTAITGQFASVAGLGGQPLTKIAFGTPGSLTGRAAADWGTPITLDHPVVSASDTFNVANSSGFFTGNRYFKFSGSGKTATFDKSQAGIVPTGFTQGARNTFVYVLTDNNVLVELQKGGTTATSTLKVYNLTITDTAVVATTDYTINIPQGQTATINDTEYTDFNATNVWVYNGEVYVGMSSATAPSQAIFDTDLQAFNVFSVSRVSSLDRSFVNLADGTGWRTPNTIGTNHIRGYRVRSFLGNNQMAEVFINSGVRTDDLETIAGVQYFTEVYPIAVGNAAYARIRHGLRTDGTEGGVISFQGFINQLPLAARFEVSAFTGAGAIPGSRALQALDIQDLDLTTTINDTDTFPIYRRGVNSDFQITIATLKGVLNAATGGLNQAQVKDLIGTDVANWALDINTDLIPEAKLTNAPGINLLSTGFTSPIGKEAKKLYGDNNELAFFKTLDSDTGLFRPAKLHNIDNTGATLGFDGTIGAVRPVFPAGLEGLQIKSGSIRMLVETQTTKLINTTPGSYRLQYRPMGSNTWITADLAKGEAQGGNTEYFLNGTITELDLSNLYEYRLSVDTGANWLNLHIGQYVNLLVDYDNFQALVAQVNADIEEQIKAGTDNITGDQIVGIIENRVGEKRLDPLYLKDGSYITEYSTLPDASTRRQGELVVHKRGTDNYDIKYLSPDTSIQTPDRNKLTITTSNFRLFRLDGAGTSVRNYNNLIGWFERHQDGSNNNYLRLYLRQSELSRLNISPSARGDLFQVAVAEEGGTLTYLPYHRAAGQTKINGENYLEYDSSTGTLTGRPGGQSTTYNLWFRQGATGNTPLNILPATSLGKGWVSTDQDAEGIARGLEKLPDADKFDIQKTRNNVLVSEYTTLPAVAGHTPNELIAVKSNNIVRFYTLSSQTRTFTNRNVIQVRTGIRVPTGFDSDDNPTYAIRYDADLPDESEGGSSVKNWQTFVGYMQRQVISESPAQYTMLLYLREDMLSGLGIAEGVSSTTAFRAAFTTGSEAKTYLNFTRTPQTDYIGGHKYLGYTSAASTPPSTTGYPEAANTLYSITFRSPTTTANLNIFPQTETIPDTWVAIAGNAADWATTGNTDRVPLAKTRMVALTQAAYNTLVSGSNDEADVYYFTF